MLMGKKDWIDIHNTSMQLRLVEMRLHNPLSKRNAEIVKEFEKALF